MLNNQIETLIPQDVKDSVVLQCVVDFNDQTDSPLLLLWEMFYQFMLSNSYLLSDNKEAHLCDFQALVTLVTNLEVIKQCRS